MILFGGVSDSSEEDDDEMKIVCNVKTDADLSTSILCEDDWIERSIF